MKPKYRRLDMLEKSIGYVFKDKDLAMRALTHSSYGCLLYTSPSPRD